MAIILAVILTFLVSPQSWVGITTMVRWAMSLIAGFGGVLRRMMVRYDGSSLYTSSSLRYLGFYVRCIQAS